MNDWVLLRCAATDSRGLLRRESCEPRNHRLFESRGTVRVDILTGATLCRQCFVVSTLRFGCPRVEVTEVTSVHSAMSCDFPWPCSLGETSKTNAYSNSRDRNTRRQDFGRKKKEKHGGVLERGDSGNFRSRERTDSSARAEGQSRGSIFSSSLPLHAVCARPSYSSHGTGRYGDREVSHLC